MQTYEQAVEKVVKFWVDKSFKTLLNQNNGDDSPQGGFTSMLMNSASMLAQNTVTEEKIVVFEKILTDRLLQLRDESPYGRTVSVDYHPCEVLNHCAIVAGIDTGCFPCKTFTQIDKDNTAIARYQYGGQLITL